MPCCCYTLLIEMAIMWVSLWKHGDFMRSQMRIGIECSSRVSSWGERAVFGSKPSEREGGREKGVGKCSENVTMSILVKGLWKIDFLLNIRCRSASPILFPYIFGAISFKEIIFNTQREWKWTLSSAQSIDGQFFFVDITVLCNNNNICLCR